MVRNNRKAAVTGVLMTVLMVASSPVSAQDTERTQRLGVVNGQVKDNQVVEVSRSLTDPVLYKTETPEALPQTLRVRNATARAADGGAVWVTVNQMLPGAKPQRGTVTARTALWVDGKQAPVTFSQQGTDVLITLPQDAAPRQQVMLRSDAPVELQVPANWRGPVEVLMEITGE
ncbi:DUF5462 family protein [Citrobacter braakii]